jgi:ABC-type transport system substrate-binding protein
VAFAGGTMMALVAGVQTPDEQTLVVAWNEPYIHADALFTSMENSRLLPLPRHLVEPAYLEDPSTIGQLAVWSREFVGLGPYRLRELVEGSHLVAQANPGYILGRPKIQEICVPQPAAATAARVFRP